LFNIVLSDLLKEIIGRCSLFLWEVHLCLLPVHISVLKKDRLILRPHLFMYFVFSVPKYPRTAKPSPMLQQLKKLSLFALLLVSQILFAQSDKEKALAKLREGIELMDDGKYEESIKALEEGQKLNPDLLDFPYEMAYAHYLQKDYKTAIRLLEKLTSRKDVIPAVFQLLGNSYDYLEQPDKALEVYDAGLRKFPNSGMLHLEKGNVYWIKKDYAKALPSYEKGIEVDPRFPSNYYRAARIYLSSNNEIWGMLYGEIFMNLERNSKRTAEISELLFDTYKKEIKFTSDTSMTVSFCQQMTMDVSALKDPKNIKLPYCFIYEPTLMLALDMEKKIDLVSLNRIRTRFLEFYFKQGFNKTYPNVLFDYQQKVKDAGHLDAYNTWLLQMGDEEGFEKWRSDNENKWDNFIKWFADNQMKVDNNNRFHSTQYN